MKTTIPTTEFAPAERVPIDIVRHQSAMVAETPMGAAVLNSVLDHVFILNPQRQIVFASKNWRELLPDRGPEDLLGLRPGEALSCVHAHDHVGGCGTTEFCRECGAVKSILAGLAGRHEIHQCHLTRVRAGREEALDLLVYGSPFPVRDETYSLFAVTDVSHENRRRMLERIFFHDVLNSAGGLVVLAEMLSEAVPERLREDMQLLREGLSDLHEQVQTQRDLTAAESRELQVNPAPLDPGPLMRELVRLYQKHLVARERHLHLVLGEDTPELISDAMLLKRILGNLIKNALEATRPGQTVTAGCERTGDGVRFWVHNPGAMPRSVQLQVFSRSFSTKGLGRGLGTYSAKLLTEEYLKGQAGFTSDPGSGTTFFVELPRAFPADTDRSGARRDWKC